MLQPGRADMLPNDDDYVRARVALPNGELHLLQPAEAADLPDDGPVEWAPLVPYWSVLWRSGVALAQEVASTWLGGMRVVELGCGLAAPSLAAARAGARALATDADAEALALAEHNARVNGLAVETARVDWRAPGDLVARGPFDLVLAADVLYERESVELLEALLPRLGREVWLTDPGRAVAAAFLDHAARSWSLDTTPCGPVALHKLRTRGSP